MTQNKKKGIAKKALSISLVAAMLATSNVPAWASFEAMDDSAGFTVEGEAPVTEDVAGYEDTAILAAPADAWGDTSSIALDASIAWNDVDGLKAILDAANELAPNAGYERLAARIGFLTGDLNTDGSIPIGSVFTPWDGTANGAKANVGKIIAVELNSQNMDNDKKESYYLANTAEVAPIDITDSVVAYEATINGTTIKNDAAKKEIVLADEYEVESVRLYFTDDKKTYQDFDAATDSVTLTANAASDNKVGANLEFSVECLDGNALGLTGTYTNNTDITFIGKSLKNMVTFKSGSLTYDPTQTAASDAVKNLIEVNKDLAVSDYTIQVYQDNAGANPYGNAAILPAGNVYLGVEGANDSDYEGQKIVNTSRTTISKKNLSTLVVDQTVFDEIEFDDLDSGIENALQNAVKYNADASASFDLTAQPATGELDVKDTSATAELGDEITVTVTPKSGNLNYTGKLTIKFKPAAGELPGGVQTAFETALSDAEFTYDAKTHTVNNLIEGDLDVLSRNQFTLTSVETGSSIRNAGVYTVKLTVTSGPYKDLTLTGEFEVAQADLDVFTNGVGVTVNPTTYAPGMDADSLEKSLGLSLKYNNIETLRNGVDYEWEVTSSDFDAGDDIEVRIYVLDATNSNYTGNTTIVVDKIQKKALSALNLPEITAQKYGTVDKSDLSSIKITDENGKEKAYNTLLKDGKTTLNAVTDYSYTIKLPAGGVGTATLTIKGVGNYTGVETKTFSIVNKAITADIGTMEGGVFKSVIADQSYDYDAMQATDSKGVELEIGATNGGKTIIVRDKETGEDVSDKCEYTYTNNTSVGTATVEAKGKDGYDIYASATFKILPKQFSNSNVTVKGIDAAGYDFTGDPIEPKVTVTVTDGRYTLKENTDFVVSYQYNTNATYEADEITAVVIKGMGNYTFVDTTDTDASTVATDNTGVREEFTIKEVTITPLNVTISDMKYAGGLEVIPNITVTNPVSQKPLVKDTDYTVELFNAVNAGAAYAIINLTEEGDKNYEFSWGGVDGDPFTFEIAKKPLSECSITVVDGKVVVKNGTLTVPENEYTATKNDDGTYTVKAAEKNYTGTITVKEAVLEAPTLKVTDRTTSTVSLAWDKIEGAEGYTIWFRSEYDSSVSRKIINGADVTSWTQKGLAPGTKYFYSMKAWIKDADGNYVFSDGSPTQRGTTKPQAAKIVKTTAADGKIKVTLAGKALGATMYSMCYADSREAFAAGDFKVGIRTEYTTRTLKPTFKPGTYYICVKSYRDLGNGAKVYGAWSNTFKTVVAKN